MEINGLLDNATLERTLRAGCGSTKYISASAVISVEQNYE